MTCTIRILIVEDHVGLMENLMEFFDDRRYVLDFAADGLTALHLVATNIYDVIVLDVMLPGLSGIEVCKRMRDDLHCTTPVIIVTAKGQLQDKEQAFGVGADDYLVKPFDLRELQWRVDALYRRKAGFASTPTIRIPGLRFDLHTLTVHSDAGNSVELTGIAARILEALIRAYPGFLSYQELQSRVWGEDEVDMNTLRTHVYSLRKLLRSTVHRPVIKTLHGRGYRLMEPAVDKPTASSC